MAAKILSKKETEAYRKMAKEYSSLIDSLPGEWLCESNDLGGGNFFNEETDEWFTTDGFAKITRSRLNQTSMDDAEKLAQKQDELWKMFA